MIAAPSSSSFVTGLALGAASTLSIGPTNLLMIREGLSRGRIVVVPAVVLFCYSGIVISALAFSDEIASFPMSSQTFLKCLGVPALIYFSFMCFASAVSKRKIGLENTIRQEPIRTCVFRIMAVLSCNPLMYIELLIVPASICATMGQQGDRVAFVIGLMLATSIYCFGFSLGARYLIPVLRSSHHLAIFDAASGTVLLTIASLMTHDLYRSYILRT